MKPRIFLFTTNGLSILFGYSNSNSNMAIFISRFDFYLREETVDVSPH